MAKKQAPAASAGLTVDHDDPSPDASNDSPDAAAVLKVPVRDRQIANWFKYHPPDAEQIEQLKRVRDAGAGLAEIIVRSCPNGEDRREAIRKVREAVMTANAAIACRGG